MGYSKEDFEGTTAFLSGAELVEHNKNEGAHPYLLQKINEAKAEGAELTKNKNKVMGYAGLDEKGKLSKSQIPILSSEHLGDGAVKKNKLSAELKEELEGFATKEEVDAEKLTRIDPEQMSGDESSAEYENSEDYLGTYAGVYMEYMGADGSWRTRLYRANDGASDEGRQKSRIPITRSDGVLLIESANLKKSAVNQEYADDRYVRKFTEAADYEKVYTHTTEGKQSHRPLSRETLDNVMSIPLRDKTSQNFHVGDPTKDTHTVNKGYMEKYVEGLGLAKAEETANAIVKTVSGEQGVTINDVSPLAHTVKVKTTPPHYLVYVTRSVMEINGGELSFEAGVDVSPSNEEPNFLFENSKWILSPDTYVITAKAKTDDGSLPGGRYYVTIRNDETGELYQQFDFELGDGRYAQSPSFTVPQNAAFYIRYMPTTTSGENNYFESYNTWDILFTQEEQFVPDSNGRFELPSAPYMDFHAEEMEATTVEVTYNQDTSSAIKNYSEDMEKLVALAEGAAKEAEENVQKILNSYVYYDSDKESTWITGTVSNTSLGSGETQKEAFASIGGFRGYSNWAKTSITEEDGIKVMKFTSGNTESDAQWRILGYAFNENGIYSPKYRKVTLSFRLDPTRSSTLADRATQIWEGVYVQSVRGVRNLNVGIGGLDDSAIEDDSVVLYWYSKGFGTLYGGSTPDGRGQAITLLDYWLESSDDGFIDVEYYYKAEVLNNADILTPIAFKVNGAWQTFSPDNGGWIINNMGNTSAEELCFENFRHNAGEYPVIAVPAANREGTTLAYRKIKYEGLTELPSDLPQYP